MGGCTVTVQVLWYTRYNLVCQVYYLMGGTTGNKTLTRISVNVLCAHAKTKMLLYVIGPQKMDDVKIED